MPSERDVVEPVVPFRDVAEHLAHVALERRYRPVGVGRTVRRPPRRGDRGVHRARTRPRGLTVGVGRLGEERLDPKGARPEVDAVFEDTGRARLVELLAAPGSVPLPEGDLG